MTSSDPSGVAARLSCADSAFPRLSHEAALVVISDLGIPAVDLCLFPGAHVSSEAVCRDAVAVAEIARERLERRGLAPADVFLILAPEWLALNHPDGEVRRESLACFRQAVEFANRLQAPGLTILPGLELDGVDSDTGLQLAADELRRRGEIAAERGLALSFEPHYQSIVETPARTLQLLEAAPGIQLTLDYGHFVCQGIAQEEVDVLIPFARHVHLRQAAVGALQVPARAGAIDFAELLRSLEAADYGGYLALEYQWEEWLDCNRVDCISETAELRDLVLR